MQNEQQRGQHQHLQQQQQLGQDQEQEQQQRLKDQVTQNTQKGNKKKQCFWGSWSEPRWRVWPMGLRLQRFCLFMQPGTDTCFFGAEKNAANINMLKRCCFFFRLFSVPCYFVFFRLDVLFQGCNFRLRTELWSILLVGDWGNSSSLMCILEASVLVFCRFRKHDSFFFVWRFWCALSRYHNFPKGCGTSISGDTFLTEQLWPKSRNIRNRPQLTFCVPLDHKDPGWLTRELYTKPTREVA